MADPSDNGALRALVADLAAAPPRDVVSVLKGLKPGQRARVSELLALEPGVRPRQGVGHGVEASHLFSPWLLERVGGVAAPGQEWSMTETARSALQTAARAIQSERGASVGSAQRRQSASSLSRVLQTLFPGRPAR